MAIPTWRLPPEVEAGAQGGPEWLTVVQEAISGQEQRLQTWAKCRARYDISYSILDAEDPVGTYAAVRAVFYRCRGRKLPFRFRDPSDNVVDDEEFGEGDGSRTVWQLGKYYDPGLILESVPDLTNRYFREIYLLDGTPTITKAGVTQTVTTHYTINSTGEITFVTAPANGAALKWSVAHFDLVVRWDTDGPLPMIRDEASIGRIGPMSIRELIGAAELA